MKYLALWFGTLAAILLATVAIYLGYLLISQLLSDPNLWWFPAIILVAVCVATLVAAFDYLTEKRPPKAPRQ